MVLGAGKWCFIPCPFQMLQGVPEQRVGACGNVSMISPDSHTFGLSMNERSAVLLRSRLLCEDANPEKSEPCVLMWRVYLWVYLGAFSSHKHQTCCNLNPYPQPHTSHIQI